MKNAYFALKDAKRQRVYAACLREFASHDYDAASLDAICAGAEISKGGLYEYIGSKEELYLFVIETGVTQLYDFLAASLPNPDVATDLLDRFRTVSQSAIGFYLDHPACVELMVRASRLPEGDLAIQVAGLFNSQFERIFSCVSCQDLAFPRERLLELMRWLLAKTRADFLRSSKNGADPDTVRQTYQDEWEFMLAILANGIYQKEE